MTEFSRKLATERVGNAGLVQEVEASAAECAALAGRLMIPAVAGLRCRFRLRREPDSVIAADGDLTATVTRICVVSLEEFEQTVAETFAVRFVPGGSESDDDDPDTPDELPYTGGAIDLGEAAAEQLALALEPYPHKPGVSLAQEDADPARNPFASLAKLKRPQ